jgi:hypothetical protein
MKNIITAKLAGNILLASTGGLFVFHILVLLGVVPFEMIWGGQAGARNIVVLEIVAMLIILVFAGIVAVKAGYINADTLRGAVNVGAWLIFGFLLLNTLGNLASGVSAENFVFAPFTFVLALCAFRLAIEK